jgi:LysM repeat protein
MTDDQDKKIDIDFSSEGSSLLDRDFKDTPRDRGRVSRIWSPGLRSPGKIILWGGGAFIIILLIAILFTGGRNTPGEGEFAALQGRVEKVEGRLDALSSQSEEAIRYLREEVYNLTKKLESLERKPEAPAPKKVEKKESPAAAVEKPKETPAAPAAATQKFHTVRSGDTLFGIARSYGLTVKELADLNGMPTNRAIHPGDRLRVR